MNVKKRLSELSGSTTAALDDSKRLKDELGRHQTLLNQSFLDFCTKADPLAKWEDAARDYEQYSVEIANRYDSGVSAPDGAALFTFGSGDCGQLGHGVSDPPVEDEETSVAMPKVVKAFSKSKDMRIIASGGLTNGLVDGRGLWTWGCADDGALGREGDENLPALVLFPMRVIVTSLSLGESHGACVSLAGQAFLWGSYRDKDGKTFFPTTAINEGNGKQTGSGTIWRQPAELRSPANVVSCASGANHTVFLTGEGDVYSLGFGEQDQLGRSVSTKLKIPHPTDPDAEDIYDVTMIHREHLSPQKLKLEFSVRSIGCGAYHTLLISSVRSQVYGCGLNQYRQVAPTEKDSVMITRLSHLDGKHICFVKGGEHFSVALSTDGSVYSWGRSDQGQLGRIAEDKAGSFDPVPQKVEKLPPVTQIYSASSHVLARTRSGHVYSWGFGEMLQLGHGDTSSQSSGGYGLQLDQPLPKRIEKFSAGNVYRVSAGAQHSCVLTSPRSASL